jgi:hypothetical protein
VAAGSKGGRWRWLIRLLLLVPFIVLIDAGFYNRAEPALAGIPFFYWYQLLWVPLGALLLLPVWASESHGRDKGGDKHPR